MPEVQKALGSGAAEEVRGGMTASELIAGLRQVDPEFFAKRDEYRMLLRALANSIYRARLQSGGRLHDLIDFKQWLEELAEEARK